MVEWGWWLLTPFLVNETYADDGSVWILLKYQFLVVVMVGFFTKSYLTTKLSISKQKLWLTCLKIPMRAWPPSANNNWWAVCNTVVFSFLSSWVEFDEDKNPWFTRRGGFKSCCDFSSWYLETRDVLEAHSPSSRFTNGGLVSTTWGRQNSEPVLDHAEENLVKAERVNTDEGSCTDKLGVAVTVWPRKLDGKLWLVRSRPQLNETTAWRGEATLEKLKKKEEKRLHFDWRSQKKKARRRPDHMTIRSTRITCLPPKGPSEHQSVCYCIRRNLFAAPAPHQHSPAFEFHIA